MSEEMRFKMAAMTPAECARFLRQLCEMNIDKPDYWDGMEKILQMTVESALTAGRDAAFRRAGEICDDEAKGFLSPLYAVNQPESSFGERFACSEIKRKLLSQIESKS